MDSMQPKTAEQQQAIKLRTQGYSVNEIASLLHVSKSSVSLWVRNTQLSGAAQSAIEVKRSAARARAGTTKRRRVDDRLTECIRLGRLEIDAIQSSLHITRLLCAVMYWCEGTKIRRSEVLSFTNSDPEVVATFLTLFRKGFMLDEQKLRLTVHLHEYHNISEQLRFWSKVTNIPLAQCHKPYLKPHTGTRIRDGYQGCVSVRYLEVDMGRRLEGIAKAFLNNQGL